jgi:4-amino-4-deoxy-L-arabinose transferase-like glycosyltransferase
MEGTQIIGMIIALVVAILVGNDASKRDMKAFWWGLGVFMLMIVFLPLYFILRKPKVNVEQKSK